MKKRGFLLVVAATFLAWLCLSPAFAAEDQGETGAAKPPAFAAEDQRETGAAKPPVVVGEDQAEVEIDKSALPWERFSVNVGYFLADLTSEVRVDSKKLGLGTVIDLENSLGLGESVDALRIDALYRFGRRHRVYFTFFDISRDASRAIQFDLQVGDNVFSKGTVVNSEFGVRIYKGAYSYSFFQNEHFDIAASFGLYTADLSFGLATSGGIAEYEALTAPFPVLGLRGIFAFTDKLFLKQSIDFFWIALDSYYGRIIDFNMALEYNLFKYFGIGVGYDMVKVKIEADGTDFAGSRFRGTVAYDFGGIQLYGKLYF